LWVLPSLSQAVVKALRVSSPFMYSAALSIKSWSVEGGLHGGGGRGWGQAFLVGTSVCLSQAVVKALRVSSPFMYSAALSINSWSVEGGLHDTSTAKGLRG
jgi:hypothetical protein